MGLAAKIREAEAELEALKREAGQATCAEIGEHDWRLVGGRNAGCCDECQCSVPVYECRRCLGCDYGENDEAAVTIRRCREEFEGGAGATGS